MIALILAGGEGTRLRPLSERRPKAIMPVAGRPLLWRVLDLLGRHDVTRAVFAVHHQAEKLQTCAAAYPRPATAFAFSREPAPLGSGGAIKFAERHLDEPFIVYNGDIHSSIDVSAMIETHEQSGAAVTIAVTQVPDPAGYGCVRTAADGRVTAFEEKPDWSQISDGAVNTAIWIFEPSILSHIPEGTPYSVERQLFPALLEGGVHIQAFHTSDYWTDVGNAANYWRTNMDTLAGRVPGTVRAFPDHTHAGLSETVVAHPNASIPGDTQIGPAVAVGGQTRIGSGAKVSNTVIWEAATIEANAIVENCVIADLAVIPADSVCRNEIWVPGSDRPAGRLGSVEPIDLPADWSNAGSQP